MSPKALWEIGYWGCDLYILNPVDRTCGMMGHGNSDTTHCKCVCFGIYYSTNDQVYHWMMPVVTIKD